MTLYLSGPMSDVPLHNAPLFTQVTADLRALGHTVLNPHEISPVDGRSWEEALRADLIAMLQPEVTAIVMLPDWETSRGARLEHDVAIRLGYSVFFFRNGALA